MICGNATISGNSSYGITNSYGTCYIGSDLDPVSKDGLVCKGGTCGATTVNGGTNYFNNGILMGKTSAGYASQREGTKLYTEGPSDGYYTSYLTDTWFELTGSPSLGVIVGASSSTTFEGDNYGELSIDYSNGGTYATATIGDDSITVNGVAEGSETITITSPIGSSIILDIIVSNTHPYELNGNGYDTFRAATEAASNGDTIYLVRDWFDNDCMMNSNGSGYTHGTLTLDIGSHNLTANYSTQYGMYVFSTLLTITGTGNITTTYGTHTVIMMNNSSKITIDGPTIDSTVSRCALTNRNC